MNKLNAVLSTCIKLGAAILAIFMVWGCAPQMPPGGAGYGYGGYGGGMYGGPSAAYVPGPMGGGGSMVVPIASGPFCTAPAGTLLEIDNDSSYLIEVESSQIAPLNCDAPQSLVPARVLRRDGTTVDVPVIPAHTRAKYVFLVLNGGMNNVRVTYVAYLNLGAFAPAPAFKFTQHTYEPMDWPKGIHQDIGNGDLRTYSLGGESKQIVVAWNGVPNADLLLTLALSRSARPQESLVALMETYSIAHE